MLCAYLGQRVTRIRNGRERDDFGLSAPPRLVQQYLTALPTTRVCPGYCALDACRGTPAPLGVRIDGASYDAYDRTVPGQRPVDRSPGEHHGGVDLVAHVSAQWIPDQSGEETARGRPAVGRTHLYCSSSLSCRTVPRKVSTTARDQILHYTSAVRYPDRHRRRRWRNEAVFLTLSHSRLCRTCSRIQCSDTGSASPERRR